MLDKINFQLLLINFNYYLLTMAFKKYIFDLFIFSEPKDMSHNFDKMTDAEVTTFGLPYDYQSVMHYEKYDFSINPFLPTIVHKVIFRLMK